MIKKFMAAITVAILIASCTFTFAATSTPAAKKVVAITKVTCAVTGEVIGAPAAAGAFTVYKGHTYYFCCSGCLAKFKAAPAKYAKPAVAYPADAPHPKPGAAMKMAPGSKM